MVVMPAALLVLLSKNGVRARPHTSLKTCVGDLSAAEAGGWGQAVLMGPCGDTS